MGRLNVTRARGGGGGLVNHDAQSPVPRDRFASASFQSSPELTEHGEQGAQSV